MPHTEGKLKDCKIIYDKINRCFLDYIIQISHVNGKSIKKYPILILNSARLQLVSPELSLIQQAKKFKLENLKKFFGKIQDFA
jgi:hypothetical protein